MIKTKIAFLEGRLLFSQSEPNHWSCYFASQEVGYSCC